MGEHPSEEQTESYGKYPKQFQWRNLEGGGRWWCWLQPL